MPQMLVNTFAAAIAEGHPGRDDLRRRSAAHPARRRAEEPSGVLDRGSGRQPELVGDPRRGWNDDEDRHGLRAAIAFYPLFENAIRGHRGRSVEQHLRAMGKLFAALR